MPGSAGRATRKRKASLLSVPMMTALSLLAVISICKPSAASTSDGHTRGALGDTAHFSAFSALPCALELAAVPTETLGFLPGEVGVVAAQS